MKRLTLDEFAHRTNEVAKALRIFIPNITTNVNEAFALYQKILADEDSNLLHTVSKRNMHARNERVFFKSGVALACPECGENTMVMRENIADADGRVWKTALSCEKCLSIFYSDKTQDEWMKKN